MACEDSDNYGVRMWGAGQRSGKIKKTPPRDGAAFEDNSTHRTPGVLLV
jgi:hypothetical protein